MFIRNLQIEPGGSTVTITANYDEIRILANGFYSLVEADGKFPQSHKDEYVEMRAKTKFLFDMIKHGNIQPETIPLYNRLIKQKEQKKED